MSAPPPLPLPVYRTQKRAVMKPSRDGKKNCTELLACESVRAVGSVGRSSDVPRALDVNVPFVSSTTTVELIALSDSGRSGVTKYSYPLIVSSST